MKRGKKCPGCGSQAIGELECLADQGSEAYGESYQALGTMGYHPEYVAEGQNRREGVERMLFPTYGTSAPGTPVRPGKGMIVRSGSATVTKAGTVEAYVCTRCGRLEHYVQDPQWVEFERLDGFRWAVPAGQEEGPMKQARRCTKCQSQRVGYLPQIPDTVGSETDVRCRYVGTASVDGRRVGVGRLEAHVCTECGFLELYVAEADKVDFEAIEGFSRTGPLSSPYR